MSGNNQDYDDQDDGSQNYDNENQDQDQEYDSQDDNSQNNGNNDCDDEDNNDDGNDANNGDEDDDDENSDGPKYIRLRGLPWSATHKEILDFLKGVTVVGGAEGIHIVTRRSDGVNSGEAYVELKSKQDAAAAMKLDNATMGHRYIEVFTATPKEAKEAMRKTSSHGISYVVKLRGLPYSITEQQVEEFFNGLEIKPDREGITFVMDRRGRATGEAFVQFESQEDTEQALGRNRQKIGHRYIEIFRSSIAELKRSTGVNGRMAPYDLKDRGSNRGGGPGSDYGGNNRNNNRWVNNNGGFGTGANNTLGFNNIPSFGNSGNFGNNGGGNFGNFGNNGGGGGGGAMGNFGKFGNNGSENFGNNGGNGFGNNSGGGNMGNGGGFNRFSGNSGNFGNDFGDFGNFGNNRGNNMGGGGGNNGNSGGGFNNFSNFGNGGGNNMGGGGGGGLGNNMGGGGGGGFGNNVGGMSCGGGGGNFGPIGGGRNDDYIIMMRGLPFSSFEDDVYKFFEPIRPVNVRIHYNKLDGRHNGTAEALFENATDAELAMKRHRCKMGARYIELFYNGKGWGNNGGFGTGANNTLGFNNIPNFGNNGGGNFGNNGGRGGGMGNFGNFGNNDSGNFGNNNGGNGIRNNSGGGNMGNGGGFNRFSGNSGNFGNDFGDFDNFGNNRSNNSMGGGGGGGFNNFSNFGNGDGNNMGGGGNGGFGNNMGGMSGSSGSGGGNFGPIGGGRNEFYTVMMRGLPFSCFEDDVYKWFETLETIRPVHVRIHYDKLGRHNGTAEALFESFKDADFATKQLHRKKMGARYIELFFNGEAKSFKGGNNYSSGGGGGNSIGVGGGMGGGNAFSRRI